MNQPPSILEACQKHGLVLKQSPKNNEYIGICPFHQDHRPSFTVNTQKDMWYCFGCKEGGGVAKFLAKIEGKTVNQVMGIGRPHKTEKIVCTYDYCDESGTLLYQVVRLDPKDFRQRRPGASKGTWCWNMDGVSMVPYKLPDIIKRANAQVWIVEGEKDVLTLNAIGICATTNAGGAGKWHDGYSKWLANREVVLCGDQDEPGRRHMDQVFISVHAYAKSITRIELPQKYKDVSDFSGAFNTPGEFALAIGNRMGEAVPGLWFTPPKDATPEQVNYFNKAFTAAQSVLPATPKGRKCVADILWIITQSINPNSATV